MLDLLFPGARSNAPHPRPDHALQDDTRLEFPVPGREPPEGLLLMKADLAVFFHIVDRVGRDEALLLLLIRALRIRDRLLELRLNDLAWMLRVSNRRVIGWLDHLVRERHVVYTVRDFHGLPRVRVEIVGTDVLKLFESNVYELPTHWFETVLPLIGRTSFTVYLYLLSCERHRPYTHVDHLVATVKLPARVHARWHLRRLARRALLKPDPERRGLVVVDPAPPTRAERVQLRYLAVPYLRRWLVHVALLAATVLVLTVCLVLLRSS
jgi:hypothetical protein